MKVVISKNIELYVTNNGKQPFIKWLESLNNTTRYRVKERLDRVSLGNMGDHKRINTEIFEIRLNFGSGYRIYYGESSKTTIILLCGGDKATQSKDIKKAKLYWQDYLMR